MAIVQDAFMVPEDLVTGLATGRFRRIGSVVRYASGPHKGQIVRHLEPIALDVADEAIGVGAKVFNLLKKHKKGAAIGTIVLATVGAGAVMYSYVRKGERKVMSEFHESLSKYIDAIRNGDMKIETINSLMNSLERVKEHKDYDKFCIQLSAEEFDVFVKRIYDYTLKLANDNGVELTEKDINPSIEKSESIINFQAYLTTQKRIFERVE